MKNQPAVEAGPGVEMPYWVEARRKVNEPAPLNKRWSLQEKESILDYLHGDVLSEDVKACCYYEYARGSETLRKARREYNASNTTISKCFPAWVLDAQRLCFVQCSNFPNSPWRDLTKDERENFRLFFKPISVSPIVTDLLTLRCIGVLDAFVNEGENALNQFKRSADAGERMTKRFIQPVVKVSKDRPFIKHVVMTIDYRDGVDAVKKQIAPWLASETNEKLFKKYHQRPIHKQNPDSPNRCKERLKYLAAWRLYEEFASQHDPKRGLKVANEWTRQNRRQYENAERGIRLRPFFREKPGKQLNTKPLYKDRPEWEDAIANAKDFLAREIEYGQLGVNVG